MTILTTRIPSHNLRHDGKAWHPVPLVRLIYDDGMGDPPGRPYVIRADTWVRPYTTDRVVFSSQAMVSPRSFMLAKPSASFSTSPISRPTPKFQ